MTAHLTPAQIAAGVRDDGPWRGPSTEEFVERIARGSTPVREYVDGKFVGWIETKPASKPGQNSDLAGAGTPRVAETLSAPTGTPDLPPEATASPARSVTPAGAG